MNDLVRMAQALLYLRAMTLVGAVRSRVKRLRQPKYLVGAVVGIGYIYFIFLRRVTGPQRAGMPMSPGPGAGAHPPVPEDFLPLIAAFAAAALLIVLLLAWVIPRKAALSFSEAEIAFLFPAPVSRRMLIHYRLLSSQLALAFTALVLTLVFRRGGGFGANAATNAIGWWVILATLNMHFTGSSFVVTKLLNPTLTSIRTRNLIIAFAAAVLIGVLGWIWVSVVSPTLGDLSDARSTVRYLAAQLDRGPLPLLLYVPRLVIAPFFSANAHAFLLALGPALLVLAAHYLWVLQSEVSFEEASIAKAEKRTARVQAIQRGDWRTQGNTRKKQHPPFRLAESGRPEVAFLWKNLLSTSSVFRPRVALVAAGVIVAGSFWLDTHPQFAPIRFAVAGMLGPMAIILLLFGPTVARQDLRSDLMNADILKTYPLEGWQIVAGELLAPVAILSGLFWLVLLAAALNLPALHMHWITPQLLTSVAIGLAIIAPPFCAIQLLMPNAVAVIFPAWVQTVGNRRERGLDVLGQRIIFMAGLLLVTTLTLLPAAIAAAVAFGLVQWLAGPIAGIAAAVAVIVAVLSVELWLGIRWLGTRFERFDLSAELRP